MSTVEKKHSQILHLGCFFFLSFTALIKNISDANSLLRFPSNQDLKGAAVALVRLQETYNLDTHALSEGVLQGKKYSRHLTGEQCSFEGMSTPTLLTSTLAAGDCFELGRQSYDRNDYYHTILWMHEALKKYEQEDEKTVARHEMFDYLAYALSKEGYQQQVISIFFAKFLKKFLSRSRRQQNGSSHDGRISQGRTIQ